jgi:uncharacterized protein (DUF1778 family)
MSPKVDSQTSTTSSADPLERRTERIDLRVTATEAAFIRQAAASQRQTVTEFLVEAATSRAEQTQQEQQRIVLMNEVFDRLVQELDQPEQTIPQLAALIRRPRRAHMPE